MSFTIEQPPRDSDDVTPGLIVERADQLIAFGSGPDIGAGPDPVNVDCRMPDPVAVPLARRIELSELIASSSLRRKQVKHYALAFDGWEDYVEIPGSQYLDSIEGEFTCEVWFLPESRVGGHRFLIHFPFVLEYRGGRIRCLWHPGEQNARWVGVGGEETFAVDRWHHVALVYTSRTSTATLYVNGRPAGLAPVPAFTVNQLPWYLGGHSSQQRTHNLFCGRIDEVRLWDRALDGDAIRRNMYEVVEPEGLIAVWDPVPNEDGVVRNVVDESPFEEPTLEPGRLVGSPRWVESTRPRAAELGEEHDHGVLRTAFARVRETGELDETVFSAIEPPSTDAGKAELRELFKAMTSEEFIDRYRNGDRLSAREDPAASRIVYEFSGPTDNLPRIFLEEHYRLTSFPFRLGAGRVVRAFSLLPGEEAALTVRSDIGQGEECILESAAPGVRQSFDALLAATIGEGEVRWPPTSAADEASIGAVPAEERIAAIDATRLDFAERVLNALASHASDASASRRIGIELGPRIASEGEPDTRQRSIRNPNEGRVLHFIFKELCQDYLSVVSLVDVRVGCGYPGEPPSIVPLHRIDELLARYALPHARAAVKRTIVSDILGAVTAYDGAYRHDFVERIDLEASEESEATRHVETPTGDGHDVRRRMDDELSLGYWRVRGLMSEYVERTDSEESAIGDAKVRIPSLILTESGQARSTTKEDGSGVVTRSTGIRAPGVILAAERTVLRTGDALVEPLLGINPALDAEARRLRAEEAREKALLNDLIAQEVEKERLSIELIRAGKDIEERVRLLRTLLPTAQQEPVLASTAELEAEARSRLADLRRAAERQREQDVVSEEIDL